MCTGPLGASGVLSALLAGKVNGTSLEQGVAAALFEAMAARALELKGVRPEIPSIASFPSNRNVSDVPLFPSQNDLGKRVGVLGNYRFARL